MSELAPPQIMAVRRLLLEAAVITALALAVGLSLNYRMVMNAFSGKTVTQTIETTQVENISFPDPAELDEVRELISAGALLVDARHKEDYQQGRLAGALSLPLGEAEQGIRELRSQVPVDRVLITYCNGFGCPDSFDLGMLLLQAGYQDVRVFEGGYPEWRDAGLPLEGHGQ